MSTHAKRTQEFLLEIRRLIDALQSSTMSAQERLRICEILYKNTTDSGCVVKAKDGEPIFTLLARDVTSDHRVEDWRETVIQEWVNAHPDEQMPESLIRKLADAAECAAEMRAWPDRKVPD